MIRSERELIERIAAKIPISKRAVKGIGDDCAVLPWTRGRLLLLSTDTLVEGGHFRRDWMTPQQIGRKAVESNVSDIAAMGGVPRAFLVSLILPSETTEAFVDDLYAGLRQAAEKYHLDIIGGNITQGKQLSVTLTITGEASAKRIRYRHTAQEGDIVMVSGPLGGSAAGLGLLSQGKSGYLLDYLEPTARLDFSQAYAKYCRALIDISDGLGSEIRHICEQSGVGALIHLENIPIPPHALKTAALLGKDPRRYALEGGEDFQLLMTVPPANVRKVPGIVIGRVVGKESGIFLLDVQGTKRLLPGGYDHFLQ